MAKEGGTGKSLSPDPAPFKFMYLCDVVKKERVVIRFFSIFFHLTVHDLQPFGSTQVS